MNNLCRTCMGSPQELLQLENNTDIITKIEAIASIKVIMHNGLPNSVCVECKNKINNLFNFREVILNSDLELKKRYEALENQLTLQNSNELQVKTEHDEMKIETHDDFMDFVKTENDKSDTPKQLLTKSTPHNLASDLSEADNKSCKSVKLAAPVPKKTPVADSNLSGKYAQKQVLTKPIKQYFCEECNFTCRGDKPWRNHQRTSHYKHAKCDVCGRIVRQKNLNRYNRNHLQDHICEECGESFLSCDNLRAHELQRHPEIFNRDVELNQDLHYTVIPPFTRSPFTQIHFNKVALLTPKWHHKYITWKLESCKAP